METEIFKLSAYELVEAYKNKTLSPVEVTKSIIDRANKIDKEVNAFVLIDEEKAILQARQSEERWQSSSQKSSIDGVPTAIKDLLYTTGVAITPGVDFDENRGNKTIRFSYARSHNDIKEGLIKIKKFMKLKGYIN